MLWARSYKYCINIRAQLEEFFCILENKKGLLYLFTAYSGWVVPPIYVKKLLITNIVTMTLLNGWKDIVGCWITT